MGKVGAIILAAGMSSRMGYPKLFLKLNKKRLFRYPLELAIRQKLDPIQIVCGDYLEDFKRESKDLKNIDFLYNGKYREGMSTSLKLGIENMKGRAEATFIFLADQPFVQDDVVDQLKENFKQNFRNGMKIMRPMYDGIPGHPILVHRDLFEEFLTLEGDRGGKSVLLKNKKITQTLHFNNHYWGMDIDTIEDYNKSKQYFR